MVKDVTRLLEKSGAARAAMGRRRERRRRMVSTSLLLVPISGDDLWCQSLVPISWYQSPGANLWCQSPVTNIWCCSPGPNIWCQSLVPTSWFRSLNHLSPARPLLSHTLVFVSFTPTCLADLPPPTLVPISPSRQNNYPGFQVTPHPPHPL